MPGFVEQGEFRPAIGKKFGDCTRFIIAIMRLPPIITPNTLRRQRECPNPQPRWRRCASRVFEVPVTPPDVESLMN